MKYGNTEGYLGVRPSGPHAVATTWIIDDDNKSWMLIPLEQVQSAVNCLPYYRMPARELIDTYLVRVDSLLANYSQDLADFDSPLTSLRRPTALQRRYDEHCKVSWIISRYTQDEQEIGPVDIQEIKDIQ